jgi:hypothetical protein
LGWVPVFGAPAPTTKGPGEVSSDRGPFLLKKQWLTNGFVFRRLKKEEKTLRFWSIFVFIKVNGNFSEICCLISLLDGRLNS